MVWLCSRTETGRGSQGDAALGRSGAWHGHGRSRAPDDRRVIPTIELPAGVADAPPAFACALRTQLPGRAPLMFSNRIRRNHRRGSIWAMVLIAAAALFVVGSTSAYAKGTDGGSTTNPWIQSDQADYAPGSTVTLTGGNWQPGESVRIFVDDSNGHTWNHSADVTADDMGLIQDVFDLPASFVADYGVTAPGASSDSAFTSFPDGTVRFTTASASLSFTG